VTIENLDEYVELVCRTLLKDGIAEQMRAFKCGFNKIFPLRYLRIFSVSELEKLICGLPETDDAWDRNGITFRQLEFSFYFVFLMIFFIDLVVVIVVTGL
jgi:hypothetical protein